MATVFEDLPVELIQEVLLYFQYHEIRNMFSNLNSRFTTIVKNMSFMPIYLGFNGMSISTSEFYYRHLSQENLYKSLISLCVSDEFAFDNGLWLASHLSTFVNLRHLCLIDIKRFTFESILNSLSPMYSLNIFSVRFSRCSHIHYTFEGVPEGAYCDRIFHLFPLLRVCHLDFKRSMHDTLDKKFVLPSDRPFMPIDISLLNLRSLAISCSRNFLSHLLEHLPQLEQLKYRHTDLWLPQEHPLANDHKL